MKTQETLDGMVSLITGAARRVGAAITRALHDQGMNVLVHYRSSSGDAKALRDELNGKRPGSAQIVQAELGDAEAPSRLVRAALDRWGRLDVLVNNASVFYPTRIGEVTLESWDKLIGINLKSPFFLAQEAAPHLRSSGGALINIVDIYADRPLKGFSVYSIAKAGLVMMTKSLARELGPEVRVNAVAPGAILWPDQGTTEATRTTIIKRTALRRKGEPEDIAGAVVYLARDARYVTGQVIIVDGGRTLSS